jgi:hypothetical protein
MAAFTVTSGSDSYNLGTDGSVSTAAGTVGTWSTNASSQVVVKKIDGSVLPPIEVAWQFNDNNQLCAAQSGQPLFNFTAGGARPQFRLASNVLQVRPSNSVSFEFALHCKWSIDANVNLSVTIGTTISKLNGWVDDKKSRFIYWFRDKQSVSAPYALMFSGLWKRDTSVANEIHLKFDYVAEGIQSSFVLPAVAKVDKLSNQLYLEYSKEGMARSIALRGSVQVTSTMDLVFTISQQTTSDGGIITKQTDIQVAATFQFNNLSGNLELLVGKVNNAATHAQSIAIGGHFSTQMGANGLDINFNYQKVSGSGVPTKVALALAGSFETDQNGKVVFSYRKDGTQQSLNLDWSDLTLGPVRAEGGLNVTQDGSEKGVYGFLGLSW